MVATIALLSSEIADAKRQYATHTITQLQRKIVDLEARKKEKRKQKRAAEKKEKTQSPGSVTVTTEPKADAETHQVEHEASGVEAEMPQKIENDNEVSEAWIKAHEAKTGAEKEVQWLKNLRIMGNAGSDGISAARKEIESKMEKAMKLEIAVIFAENLLFLSNAWPQGGRVPEQ